MHFDFDCVVATVTHKKTQEKEKDKKPSELSTKKVVALHLARKGQNAKMPLEGVK